MKTATWGLFLGLSLGPTSGLAQNVVTTTVRINTGTCEPPSSASGTIGSGAGLASASGAATSSTPVPTIKSAVGSTTAEYYFLGIFPVSGDGAVVKRDSSSINAAMTVELCAVTCSSSPYFALENSDECFCNDNGPSSSPVTDPSPFIPCAGDDTEVCGSQGFAIVYRSASAQTTENGQTAATSISVITTSDALGSSTLETTTLIFSRSSTTSQSLPNIYTNLASSATPSIPSITAAVVSSSGSQASASVSTIQGGASSSGTQASASSSTTDEATASSSSSEGFSLTVGAASSNAGLSIPAALSTLLSQASASPSVSLIDSSALPSISLGGVSALPSISIIGSGSALPSVSIITGTGLPSLSFIGAPSSAASSSSQAGASTTPSKTTAAPADVTAYPSQTFPNEATNIATPTCFSTTGTDSNNTRYVDLFDQTFDIRCGLNIVGEQQTSAHADTFLRCLQYCDLLDGCIGATYVDTINKYNNNTNCYSYYSFGGYSFTDQNTDGDKYSGVNVNGPPGGVLDPTSGADTQLNLCDPNDSYDGQPYGPDVYGNCYEIGCDQTINQANDLDDLLPTVQSTLLACSLYCSFYGSCVAVTYTGDSTLTNGAYTPNCFPRATGNTTEATAEVGTSYAFQGGC